MANDTFTQQALAQDGRFRARVRGALSFVAWQIIGEADATPNHQNRVAYARHALRNLETEAALVAPGFVMRPNVFNFATSYAFDFQSQTGAVVSATTDPDLVSQMNTDWNEMAAAAGFNAAPATPPAPTE